MNNQALKKKKGQTSSLTSHSSYKISRKTSKPITERKSKK